MLTNLIFIAIIASGSVYFAAKYRRRFEETIPVFLMGMVLLLFAFGLMGVLNIGMTVVYIVAAVFYVLTFWELVKKREIRIFLKSMITPGSVFFAIMCIAFSIWNFGKQASHWDEFSHWIDIVKAVTYVNDFGTNPAANSTFQSYPPAMVLFQYAAQKVYLLIKPDTGFSEWRVYFCYQVFFMTVMLPFFRNTSFRQPFRILLNAAIILLVPMVFFEGLYRFVLIDPFISILYATGMAMIALQPRKDKFYEVYICLICAMLTLSKDVGIAFALVIALTYITIFVVESQNVRVMMGVWKTTMFFLAACFPKLLWNWEIWNSNVEKSFAGKIDWNILANVILNRDTSYRTQVARLYCDALFRETLTFSNFSLEINYVALILLSVAAMYGVYLLYRKKQPEHKKSIAVMMIFSALLLVGYVMGMCVMYMFKFSEYEALQLAGMTRYLNIAFLAVWLCMLLMILALAYQQCYSRELTFFFLIAVLICSPIGQFCDFVGGTYIEDSVLTRAPYEILKDKIHSNCDGNDRIYFIAQETTGFDYWVSRFNARPNSFNENFTWSIGESFYEGDIWTKNVNLDEWRTTLLREYDYVALYQINDYFLVNFGPLFEDPEGINTNTLYKVNRETGLLEKCE